MRKLENRLSLQADMNRYRRVEQLAQYVIENYGPIDNSKIEQLKAQSARWWTRSIIDARLDPPNDFSPISFEQLFDRLAQEVPVELVDAWAGL